MSLWSKRNVMALLLIAVFGPASSSAAQATADTLRHPPGAFVSINGTNTWYESEGQGDPIILIAGGPGVYLTPIFTHSFLAWPDYSFASFTSMRLEAANRLAQPRASNTPSTERNSEEVEAHPQGIEAREFSVFGHSYGGMVAQAYAVRRSRFDQQPYPLRCSAQCRSLAGRNDVVNAEIRNQFPEVWEPGADNSQARLSRQLKGASGASERVPPTLYMFYQPANVAKPVFEVNSDVSYRIGGDDADFIVGGDLGRFDVRRALAELQVPILILTGRLDRAVPPRLAAESKYFLPNAQFVIFEESGHAPFVEETSKFVEVVKTFLRK